MKKGGKRRKRLKKDQEEKSLHLFVFSMDRECETLVWAAPANLSQDFLPLFLPGQSSETLYGESDWNSGSDFFTMEQSGAIMFLFCVWFHQTTSIQVKKLSSVVKSDNYCWREGKAENTKWLFAELRGLPYTLECICVYSWCLDCMQMIWSLVGSALFG